MFRNRVILNKTEINTLPQSERNYCVYVKISGLYHVTLVIHTGAPEAVYGLLTVLKYNWVAFKGQIQSKGRNGSLTGLIAWQG
jgi:hypothetical protein